MQCKTCGYMMTAFDAACPRCAHIAQERARQSQEPTIQMPHTQAHYPSQQPPAPYLPQATPVNVTHTHHTPFWKTVGGIATGLFGGCFLLPILFIAGCNMLSQAKSEIDKTLAAPIASTPPPVAIVPEQPFARLGVDDLHRENKENQIAFKAKYSGKLLDVVGTINDFKADEELNIQINGEASGFASNQLGCTFPKSAQSQLAALRKGQQIVVRGRFEITSFEQLWLDDCTLQEIH